MDATDYQILRTLQNDGRITMKALAETVCMSVPSVAERVRRLEEQNVITGYGAKINPTALGRWVDAVVLTAATPTQAERLRSLVSARPEIIEAHDLAGRMCMLLRVSCTDMPAFQELVRQLQTICTTESYLFLNCAKDADIPIIDEN